MKKPRYLLYICLRKSNSITILQLHYQRQLTLSTGRRTNCGLRCGSDLKLTRSRVNACDAPEKYEALTTEYAGQVSKNAGTR